MPLERFWTNASSALLDVDPQSPWAVGTAAGGAAGSPPRWATPQTVRGFDPEDFSFLDASERDRLADAVKRLQTIASTVHGGEPNEPALADGLAALRQLVAALEFGRYGDAEAFRIGKQIERAVRGRLPEWVAELRFDTDTDSTGDPAIWVWVLMRDKAAGWEPPSAVDEVRQRLFDAAREVEADRWPYIRFRTVSEQAELDAVGAGRL